VASCVEGSRPGPGAERPVGCHLDASQLNSAESGAEAGCTCVCVRACDEVVHHVRFSTGQRLR
jgi:hypothetical protein